MCFLSEGKVLKLIIRKVKIVSLSKILRRNCRKERKEGGGKRGLYNMYGCYYKNGVKSIVELD